MVIKNVKDCKVTVENHGTKKGKKRLVISQNNAWDLQVALLTKVQAKKLADFLVK